MAEEPQVVIRRHYPRAQRITQVTSGYDNDVYIVDDEFVFKFPREPKRYAQLLFEASLLRRLADGVTLSIPKVVHIDEHGYYGIFEYVTGIELDPEDIRSLSDADTSNLAACLVDFMREINSSMSVEEFKNIAQIYPNQHDETKYFQSMFEQGESEDNPHLNLYSQWFAKYQQIQSKIISMPKFIMHNDLHCNNLRFDKNHQLIGVFDFGEACLDNVCTELRYSYRYGEKLLDAVIDEMSGAFGDISADVIRIYSVAYELSVLMRSSRPELGSSDHRRISDAKKLLGFWLGKNWVEV